MVSSNRPVPASMSQLEAVSKPALAILVPTIFCWPAGVHEPQTFEAWIQQCDIAPLQLPDQPMSGSR